jgi:hypothetical protein
MRILLLAFIPVALGAQSRVPSPTAQIAAAILPLPNEMRAGATVLGYDHLSKLVTLRNGTGDMICLADDPGAAQFHVACYHKSLEPFMLRGRELRMKGTLGAQVDTIRFSEIKAGKLAMPAHPASLYSLTGPPETVDTMGTVIGKPSPLHVVYMPFATPQSTGLSASPSRSSAWLMFPGTPKAHIMFTPSM